MGPPSRQTLLVHFQYEISVPFVAGIDTFLILVYILAAHNAEMRKWTHFTVSTILHKIPVGATCGHRPHNFLAVGVIAPIELARMSTSNKVYSTSMRTSNYTQGHSQEFAKGDKRGILEWKSPAGSIGLRVEPREVDNTC